MLPGYLFVMTKITHEICVLCTEKQLYFWTNTQFCNLTKNNIEIRDGFVYNVFIAVQSTCV